MTRVRLAVVLGVIAVLAVVATAAVAVATYRGDEPSPGAGPHVVTDPVSGATFEVPAEDWRVRGPAERISYGEASVSGPAVLDEGYCRARPEGSFRAMAGFTDESFDAWVDGVVGGETATSTGTTRRRIALAGGRPAQLVHVGLLLGQDRCSQGAVDLAMVRAGDVRVVVVADTDGSPGTLEHDELDEIAATLELP